MNQARTLLLAAVVSGSAIAMPAHATDFSFTGSFTTANDVQQFNFTVGAPSIVTLRTWSYAGGTNAASTLIPQGGFDPILSLFNSSGLLIAENDDGGCGSVATDSVTGNCWDTYLSQNLAAGDYTVAISAFSNFALGPNLANGFEGGGSFSGRTVNWAFDILNVNGAALGGAVPEPATWAMLLLGFGLIGGAMRTQRRRAKITFRYA